MARLPYQPFQDVLPSGQGTPSENVPVDPDAFGGMVAEEFARGGAQLQQAGGELGQTAIAKQQLTNEMMANDASTQYMIKATQLYGEFAKNQGKNAQAALPGFQAGMEDLWKQTLGTMPNQSAAVMLDRGTRYYVNSYLRFAQSHADEQWATWQKNSSIDRATELGNQAALAAVHNPAQMEVFLNGGADEIRKLGESQGMGDMEIDSQVHKYKGGILKDIIASQADNGDPQGAMAMFLQHQGDMDAGSQVAVLNKLKPMLHQNQGIAIGMQAMGVAPAGSAGPGGYDNNVANIRYSPGATYGGRGQPYSGFETFATPEQGVAATVRTLASYGDVSLRTAITKWAGPQSGAHDINRDVYAEQVATAAGVDPDKPLPLHDAAAMAKVVKAMSAVEKGSVKFDDGVFSRGADSAVNGTQLQGAAPAAPGADGQPPVLGSTRLPDKGDVYQKVLDLTHGDPETTRQALSWVNEQYSIQETLTAKDRAEVESTVPDLIKAAEEGVTGLALPVEKIFNVYDHDKAQRIVDEFNIAQRVGTVIRGTQWASPAELGDMVKDIDSGLGNLSTMMKVHAKSMTTGPGTTGANPDADNAAYYRLRAGAARQLQAAIEQRNQSLFGTDADPAQYAASNPAVAAAAAKIDPKDPKTFEAFATATKAVQDHLGVPPDQQHVLSRGQALAQVDQLSKSPDITGTMQQLEQSSGAGWPAVYRDLVTLGKMPPQYQAIPTLESHDGQMLGRWLNELPKDKGVDDLLGAGPDGKPMSTSIKDAVRNDPSVQALSNSLSHSGASAGQVSDVISSIDNLAYAKAFYDRDPKAAQNAVTAFTGKFEFMPNGGARVPTAIFDKVSDAAHQTVTALDPKHIDIPAIYGQLGMPGRDEYLDMIKANPTWITAPTGDGLMLMDPYGRFVRDTAGQVVTVPFNVNPGAPTASLHGAHITIPGK